MTVQIRCVDAGQALQEFGRPEEEDDSHQDQQNHRKHPHELLEAVSEIAADHVRQALPLVADGQHSGKIVVNGTGEDAAEDDPDQRHRAVERAQNRTVDRPEPGDVQQLDEEDLPGRHNHVIHTIRHGHSGRLPQRIDAEGPVDDELR